MDAVAIAITCTGLSDAFSTIAASGATSATPVNAAIRAVPSVTGVCSRFAPRMRIDGDSAAAPRQR